MISLIKKLTYFLYQAYQLIENLTIGLPHLALNNVYATIFLFLII